MAEKEPQSHQIGQLQLLHEINLNKHGSKDKVFFLFLSTSKYENFAKIIRIMIYRKVCTYWFLRFHKKNFNDFR